MKRSAPLQRCTPLKSKKPLKSSAWPIADRATQFKRSAIKARVKKPTIAEGAKYLDACRGERCYLDVFGVCLRDPATVVPCHSNQGRHGKGMGIKARHEFTVPGCRACHVFIDQGNATREYKFSMWDRAYAEWGPVRARKLGIEITQLEEV